MQCGRVAWRASYRLSKVRGRLSPWLWNLTGLSHTQAMQRFPRGFTIIELLVVIAIVGILSALAVPSFRAQYDKRSVLAAAELLINDIRYTRSEAIRRTNTVSICSSSNGSSCSAAASWATGWLVFVDLDGDGVLDVGETLLKTQSAPNNVGSMASAVPVNDRKSTTFQAAGWAKSADQTYIIKAANAVGSAYNPQTDACLVLGITGRPSFKTWGTSTCP